MAYGLVALFAMFQFGPNMGVGALCLSWLMAVSGLLGRSWLGAFLLSVVYLFVGVANLQGWVGDNWYLTMTAVDWARSGSLVIVITLGVAYVLDRINSELAGAWEREASAVMERAETERTLLRAQRLEGIGRLAGGVAHDFNNSLAVLVAGLDALKFTESRQQREHLIYNMEQAARGAVATTNQLLSLSRQGLEPGKPGSPETALSALVPNLKRLMPETIEINADLQATDRVGLSNGDLEQVVLNLCLNARDAMPSGGRIDIRCNQVDEQVAITVSDSGQGMDEATRAAAFSAFFTTKDTGTGLGLAMVKDKLDSVHGCITMHSEPGAGTTVTLSLPALPDSELEPQADARDIATPLDTPGGDVLLVEDNRIVLETYREILAMAGYTVSTAETVEQALTAIDRQTREYQFDILVTDAVLPDGEPSRAIKQFRANGWKPVLVCSGYIDSDELVKGVGESDYRFLQKPFSNEKLLNTVAALLTETGPCS